MQSPGSPARVVGFGVFELDTASGELRRHGLKVRLPDQSFQILRLLLARPGEVVTRDELRQTLWTSDTFVDFDVGLNSAIRKLREALDDSAENPRFVQTLPRRGYRFLAQATVRALEQVPVVAAVPAIARRGRSRVPAAVGLLVAAIATLGLVYGGDAIGRLRGAAANPIGSLVVLPFENSTGDAAHEPFVDSVTDALTIHLAQVDGLDVISRTSARQYKQSTKPLRAIGDELIVEAVVKGTVVRSGERVRITVQLLRPATARHVWAQTYDGNVGQILTLQQRVASDVAAATGRPQARSSATAGDRRNIDPEAYDAYVAGLMAAGSQRHEGQQRAVAYFEKAIARQPDFAEAYAALAQNQQQLLFGGPLSPHEVIPKAETAARKALELDDTLAQAHRTMGQILSLYYWKWDEADREFQRAAALSPRGGELTATVGTSLLRKGLDAEAVAGAERARQLDPLSFNAQMNVGQVYRAVGQHDRAIAEFERALQMDPGHVRAHFQRGVTFVAKGQLNDAIRDLETAARTPRGTNWRFEAYLGYAYAAAERTGDARRVLQELQNRRREQYVSSFGIALIHDALGEKEPALAALERAYRDHAVEFAQMTQYPPFKTIAAEPRYDAVMRAVGLRR